MSGTNRKMLIARTRRHMKALSPSLEIVHGNWRICLGGEDLIGCVINAPVTIVSPRFGELVTPAPTIAESYGYRFDLVVLRGTASISGKGDAPALEVAVELGCTDGFDFWLGCNLAGRVGVRALAGGGQAAPAGPSGGAP